MDVHKGKAVLLMDRESGGNIILRRHDDEEEVYIYINTHNMYICIYS
jgi:hypothetical protein